MSEERLKVRVKSMQGDVSEFEVTANTTIEEFKNMIAERRGVQESDIRLIFQGRCLLNEQRIRDYNIENCHMVHLVLRRRENVNETNETTTNEVAITNNSTNSGTNSGPVATAASSNSNTALTVRNSTLRSAVNIPAASSSYNNANRNINVQANSSANTPANATSTIASSTVTATSATASLNTSSSNRATTTAVSNATTTNAIGSNTRRSNTPIGNVQIRSFNTSSNNSNRDTSIFLPNTVTTTPVTNVDNTVNATNGGMNRNVPVLFTHMTVSTNENQENDPTNPNSIINILENLMLQTRNLHYATPIYRDSSNMMRNSVGNIGVRNLSYTTPLTPSNSPSTNSTTAPVINSSIISITPSNSIPRNTPNTINNYVPVVIPNGVPTVTLNSLSRITPNNLSRISSNNLSPTTSSTLPPTTSSTLPPTTSSTLPPTTSSTLPPTTSSTLPPTTSSTLPPATSSTSPSTTSSTLPPATSSTLPPITSSTLPTSPPNALPRTTSNTLPRTTSSTLPPATPGIMTSVNPGISTYVATGTLSPATLSTLLPAILSTLLPAALSTLLPAILSTLLPAAINSLPPSVLNSLSSASSNTLQPTCSAVPPPTTSNTIPHVTSTILPHNTSTTVSPVTSSTLPHTTSNPLPHAVSSTLPPTASNTVPPFVSNNLSHFVTNAVSHNVPNILPNVIHHPTQYVVPNTALNTTINTLSSPITCARQNLSANVVSTKNLEARKNDKEKRINKVNEEDKSRKTKKESKGKSDRSEKKEKIEDHETKHKHKKERCEDKKDLQTSKDISDANCSSTEDNRKRKESRHKRKDKHRHKNKEKGKRRRRRRKEKHRKQKHYSSSSSSSSDSDSKESYIYQKNKNKEKKHKHKKSISEEERNEDFFFNNVAYNTFMQKREWSRYKNRNNYSGNLINMINSWGKRANDYIEKNELNEMFNDTQRNLFFNGNTRNGLDILRNGDENYFLGENRWNNNADMKSKAVEEKGCQLHNSNENIFQQMNLDNADHLFHGKIKQDKTDDNNYDIKRTHAKNDIVNNLLEVDLDEKTHTSNIIPVRSQIGPSNEIPTRREPDNERKKISNKERDISSSSGDTINASQSFNVNNLRSIQIPSNSMRNNYLRRNEVRNLNGMNINRNENTTTAANLNNNNTDFNNYDDSPDLFNFEINIPWRLIEQLLFLLEEETGFRRPDIASYIRSYGNYNSNSIFVFFYLFVHINNIINNIIIQFNHANFFNNDIRITSFSRISAILAIGSVLFNTLSDFFLFFYDNLNLQNYGRGSSRHPNRINHHFMRELRNFYNAYDHNRHRNRDGNRSYWNNIYSNNRNAPYQNNAYTREQSDHLNRGYASIPYYFDTGAGRTSNNNIQEEFQDYYKTYTTLYNDKKKLNKEKSNAISKENEKEREKSKADDESNGIKEKHKKEHKKINVEKSNDQILEGRELKVEEKLNSVSTTMKKIPDDLSSTSSKNENKKKSEKKESFNDVFFHPRKGFVNDHNSANISYNHNSKNNDERNQIHEKYACDKKCNIDNGNIFNPLDLDKERGSGNNQDIKIEKKDSNLGHLKNEYEHITPSNNLKEKKTKKKGNDIAGLGALNSKGAFSNEELDVKVKNSDDKVSGKNINANYFNKFIAKIDHDDVYDTVHESAEDNKEKINEEKGEEKGEEKEGKKKKKKILYL